MTDIEVLRENVIKAARAARSALGDPALSMNEAYDALTEALDALDVALTPDPWALLRETFDYTKNSLRKELERRVMEALEWREANP